MCSISGLIYFDPQRPVEESLLTKMRAVATHRGPDDHGIYLSRNAGLAFNRLSIIDLDHGHQPMPNEDGTAWLVFSGEIYNHQELRGELIRAGHRFRSLSDTEVVLKSWEEYGEQCVSRLRGMFAFAIWDERRKTLFAARDRIGIKPFHYYIDSEQFAFASEIKSLLEISEVERRVDTKALADFLRHGYTLTPNTLFRKICRLPPGHTMKIFEGSMEIKRYWEVPLESPLKIDEQEALKELKVLLEDSIGRHLMSDVPLGVFLSGGLDSSAIVAIMSQLGVANIQTFSIGYNSAESELDYAQIVARHFKTEHHELRLSPSTFRDRIPNVVRSMDEPVADAPSIPLYCLSEFAKTKVTVALSGEGSDEILGGYPTYNRMLNFDRINRLPLAGLAGRLLERILPAGKVRKNIGMLGRPLESRYRSAVIFPLDEVARMLPVEPSCNDPYGQLAQVYARCRHLETLSRMSYVDLMTWLPNALLLKADRMTMAHSLELRVPFLDHKLV